MTDQTAEISEERLEEDAPDPATETDQQDAQETQADEQGDTFPRAYVERLREENKRYRQRANDRDDLAQRLHTALVEASGRLADPTDLPYDDEHLTDPDTLTAALDQLLDNKPHLAARRPRGDVGQGATPTAEAVDLAAMLRSRA